GQGLIELTPHGLRQAGLPRRVAAREDRRDAALAEALELVDAHVEVTDAVEDDGIVEHAATVAVGGPQVVDEMTEAHDRHRVEASGAGALVAERAGRHAPAAVQWTEQPARGHAHV